MSKRDDFVLANRAYEQMTMAERHLVLEEFARLRYPSVLDRFFEAVHTVIRDMELTQWVEP